NFQGSAVKTAQDGSTVIDLPNNGLQTGQAVVYRAGSDQVVGGLTTDTLYYVIAVDPTTIKLAASIDDARAGQASALTAPAAGTEQSPTPVFSVGHVAHLAGDQENDTFGLLKGASVTGSIQGGGGVNSVQARLATGTAATSTDAMVWGVTGPNTGGLADRQGQFLASRPMAFDETAIAPGETQSQPDPGALHLPGDDFPTGQAAVYTVQPGSNPSSQLTPGTIYFVIRVDANTIKLATTEANLAAGTGINLTAPAVPGGGRNGYILTPIDARTVNAFDQSAVKA